MNTESLRHKLTWKWRNSTGYLRLFSSWQDIQAYRQVRSGSGLNPGDTVKLKMRQLSDAPLICRAHSTDPIVLWDQFYWQYQKPPTKLHNVKTIIDLGANVGYTSALWAVQYPDAKIIAVEMDPDNAEIARQNLSTWKDQCTVVEAAVWIEDGHISYGGEESWGFAIDAGGQRQARAVKMQTLFDEHNIQSVDLLKVDIEGAEHDVFSGIQPWLKHVKNIILEVHPPATEESITQQLSDNGFTCSILKRDSRTIWATQAIS